MYRRTLFSHTAWKFVPESANVPTGLKSATALPCIMNPLKPRLPIVASIVTELKGDHNYAHNLGGISKLI